MSHLQTFARLHVGGSGDVAALRELDSSLAADAFVADRDWRRDAVDRDCHIVVAVECAAPVGAAEIVHAAHDPVATLVWLGVARSARGRGIGQLLLESAVEHARGEGAAVLRLGPMALSAAALHLLMTAGFVERTYDTTRVVFEKSLWDERSARQARGFDPRFYGAAGGRTTAPAALMIAMASIDSRFMMTPQVERVLAAEIDRDCTAGADALLGMANAAMRRSFNADLRAPRPPLLTQARRFGEGIVTASPAIPSAEELPGQLSQRHVPLLRAHFARLVPDAANADWLAVLGFDGLLFQLFDPRRPDQRDQAVTLEEMRAALTQEDTRCLVISRH